MNDLHIGRDLAPDPLPISRLTLTKYTGEMKVLENVRSEQEKSGAEMQRWLLHTPISERKGLFSVKQNVKIKQIQNIRLTTANKNYLTLITYLL